MESVRYTLLPSPLGEILIAGDAAGLRWIVFQEGVRPMKPRTAWRRDDDAFKNAGAQFAAYFAGELRRFDLPLAPEGTDFQKEVWRGLCRIPYGRTVSYGELARSIGYPDAARAVGAANGKNPLPIVVPCHRVIGASGKLTGFSAGLHIKEQLLELEAGRPATAAQGAFL